MVLHAGRAIRVGMSFTIQMQRCIEYSTLGVQYVLLDSVAGAMGRIVLRHGIDSERDARIEWYLEISEISQVSQLKYTWCQLATGNIFCAY